MAMAIPMAMATAMAITVALRLGQCTKRTRFNAGKIKNDDLL